MTAAMNAIIQSVPVDAIQCISTVRQGNGYDDESLKELAASIKQHGMLQPIIIRKREDADDSDTREFKVIVGRRRLMASILNDMTHVPAIVAETDDAVAVEMEIVENVQRENMTLADTARAVRMLATIHRKPATVCKILGKSPAWVSKHLTVTGKNCPPEVADLINVGELEDLETALLMIQIYKNDSGGDEYGKALSLALDGNLSREKARTILAKLKNPKDRTETSTTVHTPAKTTTTTQGTLEGIPPAENDDRKEFNITLPISLIEKFHSLGAEEWLIQQIKAA